MSAAARRDRRTLNAVKELAESKGFRLHHCVPMTSTAREYWMVQCGSMTRFLESLGALQTAVADMQPYRPRSPASLAQEAALRAALDETNAEVVRG